MVIAVKKLKTLTPWKESYDQPRQYIKKQRYYFAHKGSSSQAMVFPVVMYGCESWTIKKVEHRRINAFLKFYFIFKLYNIVLVLPNIEMNLPQVYMCSPS